jgi:hypothetical protein
MGINGIHGVTFMIGGRGRAVSGSGSGAGCAALCLGWKAQPGASALTRFLKAVRDEVLNARFSRA